MVNSGYVDESRATDNAWIESVAHHWHIPDSIAEQIHLKSGDDAVDVKWVRVYDSAAIDKLHGNHKDVVQRAVSLFRQKQ